MTVNKAFVVCSMTSKNNIKLTIQKFKCEKFLSESEVNNSKTPTKIEEL